MEAKRNKAGDYKNTFNRLLLDDEIKQLFARQRELGSIHASPDFEKHVLAIFSQQRPALTGVAMLNM